MKLKKKKRWIIVLIIVLVLIATAAIIAAAMSNADKNADDQQADKEYETVKTRDIKKTVSLKGSLVSLGSEEIAGGSLTATCPVKEVNVAVGDPVKKGDILFTFDTSDLSEDIDARELQAEIQKKTDENTIEASKLSLDQADQSGKSAVKNAERAENQASADLNTAKHKLKEAKKDLKDRKEKENIAEAAVASAQSEVDKVKQSLANVKAELDQKSETLAEKKRNADLQNSLDALNTQSEANNTAGADAGSFAPSGSLIPGSSNTNAGSNDSDIAKKSQELRETAALEKEIDDLTRQSTHLSDDLSEMEATLADARQKEAEAEADRKQAETDLQAAKDSKLAAKRALEGAAASTYDARSALSQSHDAQENALEGSRLAADASEKASEAELEKQRKELEKGIVTAPADGVVTLVSVKPGKMFTGDTAVIIEDTANYRVQMDVDEADISNIEEGMTAEVRTDATEDTVLPAKVTFISYLPLSSENTMSGSQVQAGASGQQRASYRVFLTLINTDQRLRLGMSAKINLILTDVRDVLSVPIDAVNDDAGKSYIQVIKDEKTGETDKIPVETGVSDENYVEVSGSGLKEGMKLKSEDSRNSASEIAEDTSLEDSIY
ncbi:MAG: HlyD family efflux transporter periplasmic adaptor subunit [Lachnospiraceae bacterium]|nr:HlyD family efflux transporter periplasmic adaptor subunit [Lachnospiraceae bacterium]MEE3461676.1 HlyD family efflux transporter periplasmic adaptor subunit [Lachnospiraceae bacterium]